MTDSIPPETKTTASPSDLSNQFDFERLWEQFVSFARSRISNFVIDATNQPVLEAVLAYFAGDEDLCQKRGVNLQKGLFLLGPVGCGKTSMMQWFAPQRFQMVATRDIARKFIREGHAVLERYGAQSFRKKHLGYGPMVQYDQPLTYCFDDLGVEQSAKHFGNNCNVMAEIILDRYDQFIRYGMLTHMTTNLNAQELEKLYGERVRSRLREMFNLISFPAKAPDRRE